MKLRKATSERQGAANALIITRKLPRIFLFSLHELELAFSSSYEDSTLLRAIVATAFLRKIEGTKASIRADDQSRNHHTHL